MKKRIVESFATTVIREFSQENVLYVLWAISFFYLVSGKQMIKRMANTSFISPENLRELYDSIESRSVSKIVTSFMTIEPLRDEIKKRILPRRKVSFLSL